MKSKNVSIGEDMCTQPGAAAVFGIKRFQMIQKNYF